MAKLCWGDEGPLAMLGLSGPVDLVLASDVVYGASDVVFDALANTIDALSNEGTLVLLGHAQGAAPGVHTGGGSFFDMMRRRGFSLAHIDGAPFIPVASLHPEHRKNTNVLQLLKRDGPRMEGVGAAVPRSSDISMYGRVDFGGAKETQKKKSKKSKKKSKKSNEEEEAEMVAVPATKKRKTEEGGENETKKEKKKAKKAKTVGTDATEVQRNPVRPF